jgi:SAM-dependent methyltransferase
MGIRHRLKWLDYSAMRHVDVDSTQAALLRQQIIKQKSFLRRIYLEWYEILLAALPSGEGKVLEIGGSTGFLKEVIPQAIISDVFYHPGVEMVANACKLPFEDNTLQAIVMTNVLHHISSPTEFFNEASRCVRPGGVVAMVEPWVNIWASFIYSNFHHEPFNTTAEKWQPVAGKGLMTTANNALPWIIFKRDRSKFEEQFPHWKIRRIEPIMPLRFVLSGGVSSRQLVPTGSFGMLKIMEKALSRYGLFATIILERR